MTGKKGAHSDNVTRTCTTRLRSRMIVCQWRMLGLLSKSFTSSAALRRRKPPFFSRSLASACGERQHRGAMLDRHEPKQVLDHLCPGFDVFDVLAVLRLSRGISFAPSSMQRGQIGTVDLGRHRLLRLLVRRKLAQCPHKFTLARAPPALRCASRSLLPAPPWPPRSLSRGVASSAWHRGLYWSLV